MGKTKKNATRRRPVPKAVAQENPRRVLHPAVAEIVRLIKLHDELPGRGNDREIWNILTALRGPDSNHQDVKIATTGVIRHALGLMGSFFVVFEDKPAYAKLRIKIATEPTDVPWHFIHHAMWAFESLGLNWYKVNC